MNSALWFTLFLCADEAASLEVDVGELKAEERNLIDDLDDLVEQREKTEGELARLATQLDTTRKAVDRERTRLAADTEQFERLRGELQQRAVRSFRFVKAAAAQFVISADGPLDALRRLGFASRLISRDFAMFDSAVTRREAMTSRQRHLEQRLAEVEHTAAQLHQTQKALSVQKDAIDRTLLEVRERRTHFEQTIYDVREAEARLEREKDEAEANRDPFREFRGQLSWPVQGAVVKPFGRQVESEFGTVTFHSGWQIGAAAGSEVQVVAAGEVVERVKRRGLGEIVVVRHSEVYHSVYVGLADVFRKPGDSLREKATIGRVKGNDGLYFELRRGVTPEDPTAWLLSPSR